MNRTFLRFAPAIGLPLLLAVVVAAAWRPAPHVATAAEAPTHPSPQDEPLPVEPTPAGAREIPLAYRFQPGERITARLQTRHVLADPAQPNALSRQVMKWTFTFEVLQTVADGTQLSALVDDLDLEIEDTLPSGDKIVTRTTTQPEFRTIISYAGPDGEPREDASDEHPPQALLAGTHWQFLLTRDGTVANLEPAFREERSPEESEFLSRRVALLLQAVWPALPPFAVPEQVQRVARRNQTMPMLGEVEQRRAWTIENIENETASVLMHLKTPPQTQHIRLPVPLPPAPERDEEGPRVALRILNYGTLDERPGRLEFARRPATGWRLQSTDIRTEGEIVAVFDGVAAPRQIAAQEKLTLQYTAPVEP